MSDSKHKIFTHTDCIPEQTMFDYIDYKLSAKERHTVEKHLLDCELCSDALEGLGLVKDRKRIGVINQHINESLVPAKDKKIVAINYRTIIAVTASLLLLIGGVFFFQQTSSKMEERMADLKEPGPPPFGEAVPEAAKADSTTIEISEKRITADYTVVPSASEENERPKKVAAPPPVASVPLPITNLPAAGTTITTYDINIRDEEQVTADKKAMEREEIKQNIKTDADKNTYSWSTPPSASSKTEDDLLVKKNKNKDKLGKRAATKPETKSKMYKEEQVSAPEKESGYGLAGPVPTSTAPAMNDSTQMYTIVDEMPEYPGGNNEMLKFISANLKYPKQEDVTGTVFTQFIVNEEGKIIQPKIIKGIDCCPEFNDEVIRVIKIMPKWKPAKNKGKTVSFLYTLPVKIGIP